MADVKPFLTEDGSYTLFHPDIDEHYHSTFGAIQESRHVFIESGLGNLKKNLNQINILEVGFGTGLNALLALKWSKEKRIKIEYTSIEPYPISLKMAHHLNFPDILDIDWQVFLNLHTESTDNLEIIPQFFLRKLFAPLQDCKLQQHHFDVVFFDAFSPDAQPEMWTEDIFSKIADAVKPGGILTTYSSKGIVKRALKASGFDVEKLPGPPGKREIVRAIKWLS